MGDNPDFTMEMIPNISGTIITCSFAEYPHGGLIFGYITCEESKYMIHVINLNYVSGKFSESTIIYQDSNPLDHLILFLNDFGNLFLFFNQIQDKGQSKIFIMKSTTYGKTWEAPIEMFSDNPGWLLNRRVIKILPNTLLLPVFHPLLMRSMMIISTDNFKNYTYSNCIEPECDDMDDEFTCDSENPDIMIPRSGNSSPIGFQASGDEVLVYISSSDSNYMHFSESFDIGYTWNETKTTSVKLKNSDFDILAIYDQYGKTTVPSLAILACLEDYDNTTTLTLYRAEIFPDHWVTYKYLEKNIGEAVKHPFMIETLNDEIHLLYIMNDVQIKHVYFKKSILK